MSGPHRTEASRRGFLTGAAGGLAAFAASHSLPAFAQDPYHPIGEIAPTFAKARASDPRLLAFANAAGEFDLAQVRVEGKIPEGLRGAFYRNGPALFERDGVRYRHWFDGDGLVQRWSVGPSGIGYRGRFVATHKRGIEEKTGTFVVATSGGGIPIKAPLTGSDSTNPSNTSILPVDGAMWALWEGGSAVELDAETLVTKGYVDLGEGSKGAPFSAHPRVGEDGRIWNVGSLGSRVILYRLSKNGKLEQARIQPLGQPGYYHDFLLTSRSLVVIQCSTQSDATRSIENGSFGSMRAVPGKPMKVHVFDRESFELIRQAELPEGFVFHFGNGWEDKDGTIRFDMAHDSNADLMLEFFKPMRGIFPDWNARAYRVTLPVKGAPLVEPLQQRVEFPKVNPHFESRRNRFVYMSTMATAGRTDWFDAVVKIDLDNGKDQVFRYGPEWMIEEHLFVPRPGGITEDDGWLVGTALNWKKQKSAVTIFDAAHPERGFLARGWLDTAMPLGLHGQFGPASA